MLNKASRKRGKITRYLFAKNDRIKPVPCIEIFDYPHTAGKGLDLGLMLVNTYVTVLLVE